MGVEKAKLEEKPVRIMKIHFVDIVLLKPHEELDPEESRQLIESINEKGVFYKPILADKDSFIILDGHHRWDGLKRMGVKKIPCLLLDYFDNEIKLYTWYPVLNEKLEKILEFFDHDHLEGYENYLEEYTFVITDGKRYYGLRDEKDIIRYIESKGYNFEYVDTIETALKGTEDGKTVFLRRSRTKKEIIEKASRDEVFSPKTTRHWFLYKYPYLYIKKERLIS